MNDSLWHVVLVLLGIAIGVGAGYLTFPAIREAKRLREQVDQLLQDHESYKASVNAHFRKTADLVGEMTKSYAAVYDHLAVGARRFCDDAGPESKLPFGPSPGALASPVIDAEEPPAEAEAASADDNDALYDGSAADDPDLDSSSEATTSETQQRAAS